MTENEYKKAVLDFLRRNFSEDTKIRIIDTGSKDFDEKEYTILRINDDCTMSCLDSSGAEVEIDASKTPFYKLKGIPMFGYTADEGEIPLENCKEVAEFIMKHGIHGDVEVYTQDTDDFVLNTYGIYLNKICSMDYRAELLAVLLPMQQRLEEQLMGCEDEESEETALDDQSVSNQSMT